MRNFIKVLIFVFFFVVLVFIAALSTKVNFISQRMWTFWIVCVPRVSFSARTTSLPNRFPTGPSSKFLHIYIHHPHTHTYITRNVYLHVWTCVCIHFLINAHTLYRCMCYDDGQGRKKYVHKNTRRRRKKKSYSYFINI